MEITREDFELANNYPGLAPRHMRNRRRKKILIRSSLVGENPDMIIQQDNLKVLKKVGKGVKKATKAVGKTAKKVGKGIGKGAKAVGKTVQKIAKKVSLAPLIPLKGVMKAALKKKGFNPPKKLEDIAEAFHNNVVAKQNSLQEMHFDGYNDHLITVDIVANIVKFVKDALAKKKAKKTGSVPGVQLSPVEELVADGSEKILSDINKKAVEAGVPINDMPGSNAKESSTSGVAANDQSEANDRAMRKGNKSSEKGFPKMAVYGGAAVVAAYLLLKK